MAKAKKLSSAQFEALTRISTPVDPAVKAPYKYFVKERTARSLINKGLAQKVGERVDITTCCTQLEVVPTPFGRAVLHQETLRREAEKKRGW